MSQVVISVENLSKSYQLGVISTGTFYGDLKRWWARQRGRPDPDLKIGQVDHGNRNGETIWAVKDVNFSIRQGEAVGIIGRNGAGKSTLLKILSQVTAPTSGEAKVKGRIASLLEVGTGFHPELTGRENIYLNGTILGMSRHEIRRKFNEIVDFSGVDKFIDTPVKRYSSGMYVRLAFAVAAHLEPEILIVDEVLSVGDSSFQKKSLGKMEDVTQQGRTVLFVSHNMPAITRICSRAILLDKGCVINDGPTHEVVGDYLQLGVGSTAVREWPKLQTAPGNNVARLCAVRVRDENGNIASSIDIRRPVGLEMEYEVLEGGHVLVPNFHFFNEEGLYVFVAMDNSPDWKRKPRAEGRYLSIAWIPGNLLSEGTLLVGAALSGVNPLRGYFYERDAVAFHVTDSLDGDSARGDYGGPMPGVVRPLLSWTTSYGKSG